MTLVADLNPAVSVPFSRMRQLLEDTALQAGVVGATDFKVAQRAAGANMSVDVPAGQAWVEVTTGTRNGLAHVVNDATANVVVSASNGTNPRIDQIILRYNDSSIPTGSGDVPTLAVLTGTATGGATLDNRTGAATLTADSLRLADILVPAASSSVTTANIRDRRLWARGAYTRITATADQTTSSTTHVLINNGIQPRIECSGNPLRAILHGSARNATAAVQVLFDLGFDGTAIGSQVSFGGTGYPASMIFPVVVVWDVGPSAGSHLIGPMWAATAGTNTFFGAGSNPIIFTVEELVKPNANNT